MSFSAGLPIAAAAATRDAAVAALIVEPGPFRVALAAIVVFGMVFDPILLVTRNPTNPNRIPLTSLVPDILETRCRSDPLDMSAPLPVAVAVAILPPFG